MTGSDEESNNDNEVLEINGADFLKCHKCLVDAAQFLHFLFSKHSLREKSAVYSRIAQYLGISNCGMDSCSNYLSGRNRQTQRCCYYTTVLLENRGTWNRNSLFLLGEQYTQHFQRRQPGRKLNDAGPPKKMLP